MYNFTKSDSINKREECRVSDINKRVIHEMSQDPISDEVRTLIDKSIPDIIPENKETFVMKWDWKQRGHENKIDLGKIDFTHMFRQKMIHHRVLNHVEIHVLWMPHIPVNNCIDTIVEAKLIFNEMNDEDIGTLAKCVFPSPLHAHMIFYPGHSCSIGVGKKLPWTVTLNLSKDNINKSYTIADIYIKLIGYNSMISTHTKKRGAALISMIPLEEEFSGITLCKPRVPGGEWKVGNYKTGIKQTKDQEILMKLSQYGVDIEGLQLLGKLSMLIKAVKKINLNDSDSTKRYVLSMAINHMRPK